jgi:hypothetical protein
VPRLALVALLTLAATAGCRSGPAERVAGEPRWYRGNTHTHTLWSDGDAAPEAAIDWYVRHGYDFLVLSDHNIVAEGDFWRKIGDGYKEARPEHVAELRRRFGAASVRVRPAAGGGEEMRLHPLGELRAQFERPGFLMITGEEISDLFAGAPIHHNALNIEHTIAPPGGPTVRDLLRRTLALVAEEGRRTGRPVLGHLNHPNYGWAVSAEDLAAVAEERYFEVYNGHRLVNNYGDADHRGAEAIWDYVLTLRLSQPGGQPLYALATDDAHDFRKVPGTSNPGRGWVVVRARSLTADAIVTALGAGDFYASSGVRLRDVRANERSLTVEVEPDPGVSYAIRFIGTRRHSGPVESFAMGETLAEVDGPSATYTARGDELYVRATIVSSRRHPNGYSPVDFETAWVQPIVPAAGATP